MGRPRKDGTHAAAPGTRKDAEDDETTDDVIASAATPGSYDHSTVNDAVLDLMGVLNERATSTKGYLEGDHAQHTWGITIPHLAFQYLIGGSNVLPAQRYFGFSGLEKSFKSTLVKEIGNWHRAANGVHIDIDTEKKTSATALDAMVWWHPELKDNKARYFKQVQSIDEWMSLITGAVEHARTKYKYPPGKRIPLWISVDSLNHATSEDADRELRKEGTAVQRGYPVDNLQITNWFKAMNLLGTTVSLGWVQHLTQDLSQVGGYGPPAMKEKGAKTAGFMASCHIRMNKGASIQAATHASAPNPDLPVEGYTIWMNTARSCIGPDDRTLAVDLLWQYVPQPDGSTRQAMWFDWDGALGRMLWMMKYSDKWSPKMFAHDKERLKTAIDFTELKVGHVKCNHFDMADGTYTEFGQAIKADPAIRLAVSRFLGIAQFPDIQTAEIDYAAGDVADKKKKGR